MWEAGVLWPPALRGVGPGVADGQGWGSGRFPVVRVSLAPFVGTHAEPRPRLRDTLRSGRRVLQTAV